MVGTRVLIWFVLLRGTAGDKSLLGGDVGWGGSLDGEGHWREGLVGRLQLN